ncbi:GDSL esterase/lipase 5-like [Beta vulgaris subsp. vulgaris]|uniref:GDSL esterase/lipase 5-like n=1 Tax=Beta vulgaris subsp. vulgaris TaxID=3555 RepID=UPI0020367BB7|nr:GDSL esterase/lipase 5-like [Beta vulgaris subsp. vulgaris]
MVKQGQISLLIPSTIFIAFLVVPISAKNPLFIFGDSILDAGNNNYIQTTSFAQANFYPYGITFFNFPTGRFSDGRLICDFIAKYANLPLILPFLQPDNGLINGVNFASAGAGALVQTYPGLVINLHEQLRNYKKVESKFRYKFGDVKARKRLTKAVYMFSIGGNDYSSSSTFLTNYPKSEYVDMVIGNITFVITEIYKTGGRKFAFLNVPPLGCMPMARISSIDGDCIKEPLSYAILHNKALSYVLKELQIKLPGFKYSLYDFYTSLQQRIDHPSNYGYKEGKVACCGTGRFRGIMSCGERRPVKYYELCENMKDYVFWDSAHLTEKTYKQLADEMWNLRSYGSYNIKDLFH